MMPLLFARLCIDGLFFIAAASAAADARAAAAAALATDVVVSTLPGTFKGIFSGWLLKGLLFTIGYDDEDDNDDGGTVVTGLGVSHEDSV